MTLGERLAEVRKMSGLPMRRLDRLAGVKPGHCWLIENAKTGNTAWSIVDRLASVLGVTLDYLMRGEGEKPTLGQVQAAVGLAKERFAQAAADAEEEEDADESLSDSPPADQLNPAPEPPADRAATDPGFGEEHKPTPFDDSDPSHPGGA